MANKPKDQKPTDASMAAASEIYNVARQQADEEMTRLKGEIVAIREESTAMGAIQKIHCDIAYNETLKYMILYRIKQSKEYRKGGLTWVQFCEAIGEPDRSVDRIIEELKPVYEKFTGSLADLAGLGFNKIRHLGKALTGNLAEIQDGVIIFEGEKIPLAPEYKDEIEAILDQLKDGLKEREDEAKAQKKASDRVATETHKELTKLQKQVDKLEGKAAKKGFTAEEDAYLQHMDNLRVAFDGYLLQIDPERMDDLTGETATPRMRAAYLTAMDYFKKQILVYADTAIEMHGDIVMCAENAWKQPE